MILFMYFLAMTIIVSFSYCKSGSNVHCELLNNTGAVTNSLRIENDKILITEKVKLPADCAEYFKS